MKILRITPFLVDRSLLVRVYTDEGITGTGESGLWAHHRHVHTAIEDLAAYFEGKDPGLIEHHFQAVTRNTHFGGPVLMAALSGIDMALWDILGKSLGKPVHALLGGKCRDKVRVFANLTGRSIEDQVAHARAAVDQGYTSFRTMPYLPGWQTHTPTRYIGSAVEIVAAIRAEIGYDVDLGVELHRNLGPNEAVLLARELAPFRLHYYEDPVAPESLPALEYVARHVDIPIAAGERCHSIFDFKALIDSGSAAMIRPDLSLAGGFTQCRKIAAMAEAAFVQVFPHLMGSPVNLAAFTQFGTSIPNYALMESGSPVLNEIVDTPLVVKDGFIEAPDRPGIGVDLREEVLSNYPYRPHSIHTITRPDGAVVH